MFTLSSCRPAPTYRRVGCRRECLSPCGPGYSNLYAYPADLRYQPQRCNLRRTLFDVMCNRPGLSQRSASNPLRSASTDPRCVILRTGSQPGFGAKSRPGRIVTVRVRFGDLRSVTLEAPISATAILAEIAEKLVRAVLADYPDERTISLLAISVSHLEEHADLQAELPLGLDDEPRRPGTKSDMARWMVDRAVDRIRGRFGWQAVGYGSVALELSRSIPDEFRELAEKDV